MDEVNQTRKRTRGDALRGDKRLIARVVEMRARGATYREIADALGRPIGTICGLMSDLLLSGRVARTNERQDKRIV